MTRYERFNFFPYYWSSSDEETTQGLQTIVKAFGWNEKNESVYLQVENFQIPVPIELPDHVEWDDNLILAVRNELMTLNKNAKLRPADIIHEEKQRSYYASVARNPKWKKDQEAKTGPKYLHKKFPYLLALFNSQRAADSFTMALRKEVSILGIGKIRLKCHGVNRDITPDYKLRAVRQLPSAGWLTGKGIKLAKSEKESTRELEFCVAFEDLDAMPEEEAMKMPIVLPTVLSFDNEANSTLMSSMPKAKRPDDKTFQIGYTLMIPAKGGKPKQYIKELIHLGNPKLPLGQGGNPDPIEGVKIWLEPTEADVMCRLTRRICELGYQLHDRPQRGHVPLHERVRHDGLYPGEARPEEGDLLG
jgi:hypothetical protein